jgi:flagellar hook assembly protein FlgD
VAVRKVQGITFTPAGGVSQNNQIGPDGQDPSEQFIKLLVAQLTNQDPDKPMDATAMITQFAQVQSAVGLDSLIKSSQNFQRVSVAGALMGQKVTVYDKEAAMRLEGTVKGVDFSGTMPFINVDGVMYPLDAILGVGER